MYAIHRDFPVRERRLTFVSVEEINELEAALRRRWPYDPDALHDVEVAMFMVPNPGAPGELLRVEIQGLGPKDE